MPGMDDHYFDPFATSRTDLDRAPGPFKVNEQLPAKVVAWKNRLHPVTKLKQKLIDFSWQRHQTETILDSLEHYTHEWTIFVVKRREALDKTDRRDHAQSLFTLDRNGTHRTDGRTLWDLRQPHAANATANAIAAADAALIVTQQAAIDALVADANSPVLETDRTVLTSFCDLSQQEFMVYDESVRVFRRSTIPFRLRHRRREDQAILECRTPDEPRPRQSHRPEMEGLQGSYLEPTS